MDTVAAGKSTAIGERCRPRPEGRPGCQSSVPKVASRFNGLTVGVIPWNLVTSMMPVSDESLVHHGLHGGRPDGFAENSP